MADDNPQVGVTLTKGWINAFKFGQAAMAGIVFGAFLLFKYHLTDVFDGRYVKKPSDEMIQMAAQIEKMRKDTEDANFANLRQAMAEVQKDTKELREDSRKRKQKEDL